jgi:hypothetical protein
VRWTASRHLTPPRARGCSFSTEPPVCVKSAFPVLMGNGDRVST